MQDLPGAPGTARQGRTRIIVSTNDGGKATQPRAPGHERPRAAQRAARHGRLSAALRAPGADVPLAMTAGAPGQHCLSAAPRAPGHERPLAAQRAAGRDRLSATPRAPGADVPLATAAGAPGQYCLSAVPSAPDHDRSDARHQRAPGHGRPLAASSDVAGHGRPRATPRAPGADVPLATAAGAPGQHRLRAMANATVSLPAGLRRLRQECLPRVPANPRTLTYPRSHRDTAHTRTKYSRAFPSPCAAGGLQGGQVVSPASSLRRKPRSRPRPAAHRRADSPSLPGKGPGDRSKLHHTWHYPCGFGLSGVRSKPQPTHQVHPAIQVSPHPRSCSTAATGFSLQHPSRAPPWPSAVPLHCGGAIGGPGLLPSPHGGEGPGGGAQPHHTWQYPCGRGPSQAEAHHPVRRRPPAPAILERMFPILTPRARRLRTRIPARRQRCSGGPRTPRPAGKLVRRATRPRQQAPPSRRTPHDIALERFTGEH